MVTRPPVEHVQPAEVVSLEQAAQQVVSRHRGLERDLKGIALQVHDLLTRYMAEGRTGFYAWIESQGIPRATAHRYVDVALAIHEGLDPDGSRGFGELADLGQALRHGEDPQALRTVQSPQEAAHKAEAARNFGVVRVPITADYKAEWTGLIERTVSVLARRFEERGLESIEVVPPDAAGLLVMRVNALTSRMSDEQFRLWLEGTFHGGMEG